MNSLMNEMIAEAKAQMNAGKVCYGFAHRDIEAGSLSLRLLEVNTNSKRGQLQRVWSLNGKRTAAAKVAALNT